MGFIWPVGRFPRSSRAKDACWAMRRASSWFIWARDGKCVGRPPGEAGVGRFCDVFNRAACGGGPWGFAAGMGVGSAAGCAMVAWWGGREGVFEAMVASGGGDEE